MKKSSIITVKALMGVALLAFCAGVMLVGVDVLHLGPAALRTLTFLAIVFGSQATIYAIRDRTGWWGARPSTWLIASSVADVAAAAALAIIGIAMTSLPVAVVAATLAAAVLFAVLATAVKRPVFKRLGIA